MVAFLKIQRNASLKGDIARKHSQLRSDVGGQIIDFHNLLLFEIGLFGLLRTAKFLLLEDCKKPPVHFRLLIVSKTSLA